VAAISSGVAGPRMATPLESICFPDAQAAKYFPGHRDFACGVPRHHAPTPSTFAATGVFTMLRGLIRSWILNAKAPIRLIAVAAGLSSIVLAVPLDLTAQSDAESVEQDLTPSPSEELGVLANTPRAFPGYNLITPSVRTTFLFDNEGRVVNSWPSDVSTGVAYLLDNGHLFRTCEAENLNERFRGPAKSGRFQELDWDGNIVWDFVYHSEQRMPHHDAIKLPNGNVLMICWEMIEADEAVAQGVPADAMKESHLQPDCLVEIKPTGPTTGEVVWEWRSWDHLIQDRDRNKPNYGNVADHPERFDVNYVSREQDVRDPDWMHVNAVAYNADLDQVALSSPSFSEIWIIDHSTTTEEARGHTGGRWGKGGDILYRWGNPRTYRNGTKLDQRLFFQHNVQWIAAGCPGAGRLLVFNNGSQRQPEEHSSVDELEPPIDQAGNYLRREGAPLGPNEPHWSYAAPNKGDFYSWFISGAQRLPNGNTLINSGAVGTIFEVTPEKEIVWKFSNPFPNERPAANTAPRPLQVFSNDVRGALDMKEDQRTQLDDIDKELRGELDDVLDEEQMKVLAAPEDIDLSGIPEGEYLWIFKKDKLNLTQSQQDALARLAQDFNSKIAEVLTADQKGMIDEYKKDAARRRADRRLPRNTLFRAQRYGLDHPAFVGKKLTPGKTLVELQQERERSADSQQ
jgi:hypothetical protein